MTDTKPIAGMINGKVLIGVHLSMKDFKTLIEKSVEGVFKETFTWILASPAGRGALILTDDPNEFLGPPNRRFPSARLAHPMTFTDEE